MSYKGSICFQKIWFWMRGNKRDGIRGKEGLADIMHKRTRSSFKRLTYRRASNLLPVLTHILWLVPYNTESSVVELTATCLSRSHGGLLRLSGQVSGDFKRKSTKNPKQMPSLRVQHPSQLHTSPSPWLSRASILKESKGQLTRKKSEFWDPLLNHLGQRLWCIWLYTSPVAVAGHGNLLVLEWINQCSFHWGSYNNMQ